MEVIILAGGLGTRLRSVVSEVPKCMALVAGKPFLWYLLKYLTRSEVSRVILSVGYLREVIFKWIDEVRDDFPFKLDYAVEEEPLGTGGGIRLALCRAVEDDVVVLNGDTFFDIDLAALVARHRSCGAAISLALKSMRDFDRYGAVEVGGDLIVAFHEKGHCQEGLINGGVYCISRSRVPLEGLPEKFSFEKEVLEPGVAKKNIYGFDFGGYFIDIGIPEDYQRADETFRTLFIDTEGFDTLLLDRDGVINRLRPGDYVKCWGEFEFLPGVLDAFAGWARRFKYIFVMTNQRGVGKGLMSEQALQDVHRQMCEEITAHGGRIDGIYYCTALSCEDIRRKPGVGMFREMLADHPDVRPERCLMVGDSESDMEFARNCGIRGVRI